MCRTLTRLRVLLRSGPALSCVSMFIVHHWTRFSSHVHEHILNTFVNLLLQVWLEQVRLVRVKRGRCVRQQEIVVHALNSHLRAHPLSPS
jgi:hypothetical protein